MLKPDIARELRAIVGEKYVLDSFEECYSYSYDATPLYRHMPDGVVIPGNREEVQAIVRLCSRYEIPIVSRGSGTNLSAGTVPVHGGLVLVMTRMNRILEIDDENLTVTFQPGVITADLHKAVEAHGLFYPPDPGSMRISTLGGNIAECAGGLRGLKYGVTKDYIIGLEAVLPNGEVIRTGGKNAKDVAGYDFTKLLVGSEGTLAVITEATARLIPLPETRRTMVATFKSLRASAQAVSTVIANRIIPATMEFLDNPTIRVVEDFSKIGLPTDAGAMLLIEQDGAESTVERDIERIATICRQVGAEDVQVASSEAEGLKLMQARRMALSALARKRPTTILEDATVPRARLAEMVEAINEISQKYDVEMCTFGHAGDGNLHPTCLTDERDEKELRRVEQAFHEIFLKAIDLGGTITGEHGVGLAKADYLSLKLGEVGVELMKAIKSAIDPQGIMNPGKLFARDTRRRVVVSRHE
jgi:glycolate oxidase